MSVSTHGLRLKTRSLALRTAVELLSSMRFAISLLTVICIASIIGTVLKQHEPLNNYVNQFGPFWAELFGAISLYSVYSAWWFLLILAFLVISTSLCVARNTPKILVDLRNYKEGLRAQSLKAFGHHAEAALQEPAEVAARRIGQTLASGGWKVKLQQRDTPEGSGWMVAAKAGAANKLGYIAAHSAIVLVCLGGLLDGDLVVRAQTWFTGKTPFNGSGSMAEVGPQHRLSTSNPTFRANLMVPEGAMADTAVLTQPTGVFLQELPFAVELKKFVVEYYSTGMPKLFASDIVIHDRETGEKVATRVEVNHPASYRGIEIYQSSFDDGGSSVKLEGVPMSPEIAPFEVQGTIGGSTLLAPGNLASKDKLTLEFTGLRVINVENFGAGGASGASAVDVRKVDLRSAIDARLGAANKTVTKKELRNIGPSIGYKLRDSAGQAREFNNYMLPVDLGEGVPVFLLGTRDTPTEAFRYLRVPADDQGSMKGFVALREALRSPALREQAVRRYVAKATDPQRAELVAQLTTSTNRALALFAGAPDSGAKPGAAGLQAISDFMEGNVPEAERARAGDVLVRILNGALFELVQLTREKAGQPPLVAGEKTQALMVQTVLSLSDAFFYPVPVAFQLKDFTQVQASVFQVARAPGKNIVYLGCALLILGIFAMLYVRDRRLWVWLSPAGEGSQATMALSTNRKTMDGDHEFAHLKNKLIGVVD